jgi:hypothetical protein
MRVDKKMRDKSRRQLAPELRFPEFKNEGEWTEYSLVDVLIKNSTKCLLSFLTFIYLGAEFFYTFCNVCLNLR